ncbi:MAG: hypothetical protein HYV27_12940 [Candidatus Hydrogenedentes bacterium]|nr:hypothetical protein [Candidatus Hydrogenedentota bacterium]
MGEPAHEANSSGPHALRPNRVWAYPAFGIVLALLLLGFVRASLHYPYYHLWDGDAVPSIDTLLIISGLPPAHVHHTAFGVYLLLVPFARIGHTLGWISLGGLPDLETSLSPYSSAAEFMVCLKLAYPFIVLVLLLSLWAALALAFRPKPLTALLLLIFLGLQEVMFWGASMIRSETTSLCFWTVAVLLLVLAAQSTPIARKAAWIFAAGALLGLAFLTKLQAAPHLVMAAMFYLWLEWLQAPAHALPAPSLPHQRITAGMALLSLAAFASVGWAAWKFPLVCSGAMTGEQTYFWAGYEGATFTLFRGAGFPIGLALLALAITALALLRWPAALPGVRPLLALAAAAAAGFVAVLFLHLLFFADPAEGWRYLLVDFKSAFLRGRDQFTETSLNTNRMDLVRMAGHFKWTLVLHLALSAAIAGGWKLGRIDLPRRAVGMTVAITVALLLISCFFVRFRENDMLWIQIPFNFFSLCYAGALVRGAGSRMRPIRTAVVAGFVALFIVNAMDAGTILRRIDTNYGYFGWKDMWVMQGIFGGHRPYDRAMKTFYTNEAMSDEGYRQAQRFQENRRLANFILQNQRVPLMNMGSVFEGFPVWREAREFRIREYSPYLREAMVIDSASLTRLDFAIYEKEMMRKHNSVPEKFEARSGKDLVAVALRADADNLLFVHEDDRARALEALNDWRRPIAEATPYRISLSDGATTVTQVGIRLLNYAEVPVDLLTQPYYFVIVPRHSRNAQAGNGA